MGGDAKACCFVAPARWCCFIQVVSKQLVGVYLTVWARKRTARHIRGVQTTSAATGAAHSTPISYSCSTATDCQLVFREGGGATAEENSIALHV
jgi:hypothetical protein